MLARLDAYALAPLPALPGTDEVHLAQMIRTLATMPRRQADEVAGEVLVETWLRMLGHLPRATVDWITDQAMRRLSFFPSVKELLDLAAEWTRGDDAVRARAMAGRLAREERQARLQDTRKAIRRGELDQDAIDALPEPIRRILEADSLLWRCDCGSYTVRPSAVDQPEQVAA